MNKNYTFEGSIRELESQVKKIDQLIKNHKERMHKQYIKEYFETFDSKERFPFLREFGQYASIAAVIKKELLEANCSLYFEENKRSVENVRGKIAYCNFVRDTRDCYISYFDKQLHRKLDANFFGNLIRAFYRQYSGEYGFAMEQAIYDRDGNSFYDMNIHNQWTLNRFTKFLSEQENYIRMNLL